MCVYVLYIERVAVVDRHLDSKLLEKQIKRIPVLIDSMGLCVFQNGGDM